MKSAGAAVGVGRRHVEFRGGKVSKGGGMLGAGAAKSVKGTGYWVQQRQSQ